MAARSGRGSPAPSLEVSLLVSRGYRVLLPNIRGSTSYGREWIRAQLGDWGGVDAATSTPPSTTRLAGA